jgi:hypothetical protein
MGTDTGGVDFDGEDCVTKILSGGDQSTLVDLDWKKRELTVAQAQAKGKKNRRREKGILVVG